MIVELAMGMIPATMVVGLGIVAGELIDRRGNGPKNIGQVRVKFDMSDFDTPGEYYDFEDKHRPPAMAEPRQESKDTSVAITCSSDDLLYFHGAVAQMWDWWDGECGEEGDPCLAENDHGYESIDPVDNELAFALVGSRDGEQHGCMLTVRLGSVPRLSGWRFGFGLLDGPDGVPLRMPRVVVEPNISDWPLHRKIKGGGDVLCHTNPQAVVEMRDVRVVPMQPPYENCPDGEAALRSKLDELIVNGERVEP